MPEAKLARYQKEYGLNEKLATQIIDSDYLSFFEALAAEGVSTTLSSSYLDRGSNQAAEGWCAYRGAY